MEDTARRRGRSHRVLCENWREDDESGGLQRCVLFLLVLVFFFLIKKSEMQRAFFSSSLLSSRFSVLRVCNERNCIRIFSKRPSHAPTHHRARFACDDSWGKRKFFPRLFFILNISARSRVHTSLQPHIQCTPVHPSRPGPTHPPTQTHTDTRTQTKSHTTA